MAKKSLPKHLQMRLEYLLTEIDSLDVPSKEKHRLKTWWSDVKDNCMRLESLKIASTFKE